MSFRGTGMKTDEAFWVFVKKKKILNHYLIWQEQIKLDQFVVV